MGKVQFKTTSDIRELERDYGKIQRENAKLIEQNHRLTSASKEAAAAGGKMNRQAITGLGTAKRWSSELMSGMASAVSGAGLLATAMSAVTGQMQEQLDLQREASDLRLGAATSQSEAIKNMAALSVKQQDAVFQGLRKISKEVGISDLAALTAAAGGAVSASGDVDLSLDAVRESAKLNIRTPGGIGGLASGSLDISRASGVRDAQQAIGFMLSTGAQARIEDPALLARNLAPAVGASVLTVAQQDKREASRESAALFSVLSKELVDKTGERTATAQRGLVAGLRTLFGEGFGEGDKKVKAEGPDPATLFGRLQAVASDEELRRQFLGKASLGEGKLAIEGLLSDQAKLAELRQTFQKIEFDAEATRNMQGRIQNATNNLVFATREEKSKAILDDFKREGPAAVNAQIRKITAETLAATRSRGVQGTSEFLQDTIEFRVLDFVKQDPVKKAEHALAMLQVQKNIVTRRDASPERDAGLELLREQMMLLREIRDEQRAARMATDKSADKIGNAVKAAAAGGRVGQDRESQ